MTTLHHLTASILDTSMHRLLPVKTLAGTGAAARERHTMRVTRSVLVGLVLLLATLTAAPAGFAQGNSSGDVCLNGGYAAYHDGSGAPFKNQGQCLKFVSQGGVLQAMPTLVITLDADACCNTTVTGKGLLPGSVVTYEFHAPGGTYTGTLPGTVQSDGTYFLYPASQKCGWPYFVVTATTATGGTISSDPIAVTCPW